MTLAQRKAPQSVSKMCDDDQDHANADKPTQRDLQMLYVRPELQQRWTCSNCWMVWSKILSEPLLYVKSPKNIWINNKLLTQQVSLAPEMSHGQHHRPESWSQDSRAQHQKEPYSWKQYHAHQNHAHQNSSTSTDALEAHLFFSLSEFHGTASLTAHVPSLP